MERKIHAVLGANGTAGESVIKELEKRQLTVRKVSVILGFLKNRFSLFVPTLKETKEMENQFKQSGRIIPIKRISSEM